MKILVFAALAALIIAGTLAQAADQTVRLQGHNDQDLGLVDINYQTGGADLVVQGKALSQGWHRVRIHTAGDCSEQFAHVGAALPLKINRIDDPSSRDEADAGEQEGIFIGETGDGTARYHVPGLLESTLHDDDGSAIILDQAGDKGDSSAVACGVIATAKP